MKLKFTTVLLAGALALSAVSFSSCKDTNDDMFNGLESQYLALSKRVDEIQLKLNDYATKAELAALENQHNTDIAALQGDIADLQSQIDDINKVLDTLDDTYVDWETYNTKVKEIEGRLDVIEEALVNIENRIINIQKYLENIDKRVSSVEVHVAYNPVFGMINLPVGINSTALFNYYGEVTGNNSFGASGMVYGGGDDVCNLGDLYFSVNPVDLDLTSGDYTLSLIDTTGAEAPVTLGDAAACDEALAAGLSRADTYVWTLNVTAEDAEAIALDFSSAKDQIKEMLESRSISSVALIPEAVKALLSPDNAPVYALKVAWQEVDTVSGETIDRAAVSQFNITANTFQPLSFNTLADFNGPELPKLPDLDALKDKYNAWVDDVKNEVVINLDNATLTINLDGVTLSTPGGDVTAESLDALVAAIEDGVNNMTADMAADLNDQIKDIIDTMTVKAWNKGFDKFGNIYDKVTRAWNKIRDLVYSPNLALQPVCFIGNSAENAFARLSESKALPTYIAAGECNILATSWTGEFLAPAYKKSINGEEIEGNETTVTVAAGETLEITYAALDFHGVEVTKTYYVCGK